MEGLVSVHLNSMGGVMRFWETGELVAGEGEVPIDLIDEAVINGLRNPDYACYPVVSFACGYMSNDTTTPAVACTICYDNLDSTDEMTDIVCEVINFAVGGDPPLETD